MFRTKLAERIIGTAALLFGGAGAVAGFAERPGVLVIVGIAAAVVAGMEDTQLLDIW